MIPSICGATEPSALVAILLGCLQGLTEFLPISSSGHLVLAQALLGGDAVRPGIAMEVILHAGTLCAVLWTYRRDLALMTLDAGRWIGSRGRPRGGDAAALDRAKPRLDVREPVRRAPWRESGPAGVGALGLLLVATLPVVLVALLWADAVEAAFEDARLAASMLLVTGLLLLLTRLIHTKARRLGARVALVMGLMQVLSLMPGISRSGATIAGGLFAGGHAGQVVRFSFLMSVPAILGAVIFELPEMASVVTGTAIAAYAAGFAAAFLSGLLAIQALLRVVARGGLHYFGLYCLAAGVLALLLV